MEIHQHSTKKSFFDQFSPKAAFLFGLMSATAVLSLVGFLVTASVLSGPEAKSGTVKSAKTNTQAATNTNTTQALSYRPVSDDDHIRGDKSAEVTLIEYSDLECPFCKRIHPTLQQVMGEYDGKVRWVYRHFPLTSLHPKATIEAEASECAGAQGKFWEYIDIVYERTPSNNGLEEAKLTEFAQELKLDMKKFASCLEDNTYSEEVQNDLADAQEAGGQGTPYSLIVDKKGNVTPISGALPFADFKAAIDAALGA